MRERGTWKRLKEVGFEHWQESGIVAIEFFLLYLTCIHHWHFWNWKKVTFQNVHIFLLLFNEKNTEAKIDFFIRKYSNIWQHIIFDENIHIFLVWTRMQFLLQCVDDWVFIRGSFRFYETCNFHIGNACSFWWKLPLPHWLLLFLVR